MDNIEVTSIDDFLKKIKGADEAKRFMLTLGLGMLAFECTDMEPIDDSDYRFDITK